MEVHAPILNQLDDLDYTTAVLILQSRSYDIEELLQAMRGSGQDGEQSDAYLAIAAYQNEIQHVISILDDRRISRSLAQAANSDVALLHESRAQTDTTVRVQTLARSLDTRGVLSRMLRLTTEANGLVDEIISQLATIYPILAVNIRKLCKRIGLMVKAVFFRPCIGCVSEQSLLEIFRLPCGHYYCQVCLSTLFQLAATDESRFPPQCCRQQIPLELAKRYLSSALIRIFEEKSIEFKSLDRTYCSRPECSSFISSDNIDRERARCVACGTRTCTICKNNAHHGDCPEDIATQQTLETGRQHGWQRCRSCRRLVERDSGCNHITCRCGAQFCYVCGAKWKTCGCHR